MPRVPRQRCCRVSRSIGLAPAKAAKKTAAPCLVPVLP
jgi:hypothetical protein